MNAKLNKCRRKLSAFSAAWDEVAERWRAVSITERQPNSEKKKKRIFFGGEIQFTLIYIRISSRSVVIFPRAHSTHTPETLLCARDTIDNELNERTLWGLQFLYFLCLQHALCVCSASLESHEKYIFMKYFVFLAGKGHVATFSSTHSRTRIQSVSHSQF